MLRRDEGVPHASPDRLARTIVEDVSAAFDLDQDFLDKILKTTADELTARVVRIDDCLLIATGNFMPTYRLPGRTEGDIIGRPFHKSATLFKCDGAGAEGDPIDIVVAPGIFSTDTQLERCWTGDWVGTWLTPIRVCVGYYKSMSAESVPATAASPEESTAGPRTRKRVKAEGEGKHRDGGGPGEGKHKGKGKGKTEAQGREKGKKQRKM